MIWNIWPYGECMWFSYHFKNITGCHVLTTSIQWGNVLYELSSKGWPYCDEYNIFDN